MSSFLAHFRGSLHTLNVLIMLLTTSNTHRYWQPRSSNVLCCPASLHMLSRTYNLPCHRSSPGPSDFSRHNMLDRDRSRPEIQPTLPTRTTQCVPPRPTYPQTQLTMPPFRQSTSPPDRLPTAYLTFWVCGHGRRAICIDLIFTRLGR